MRVLYLGESLHIHDFRFIEKLVEKGYDTCVVTFTDKPIKIEGAKYYNFPKFEKPSSYSRFVGDIIFIRNLIKQRSFLQKLINELKPDVLHAGWILDSGFIAALSGFHPFLLMPWGSDVLIYTDKVSYFSKKIIKYTIKKADMIQCSSKIMKNRINKLYGYPKDRMIVFPWGVNLKKFNPKVNGNKIRKKLGWEENLIIIMTRSFKKIYGIEFFLKSLKMIIKKHPETRVILCGDGPLKNHYNRYLEKNDLKEYVFFSGFIENNRLANYLCASDIYVSTSLSDSTSISLLEAMACGLPVVVTNIEGNKDWIKDGYNGFLVSKEDSHQIYEKLSLLLDNGYLREEFGRINLEIARRRAEWDKNFRKLEGIYNKLFEENNWTKYKGSAI